MSLPLHKSGESITVNGTKVALGVPSRMRAEGSGYANIPLRRPGRPEDAAGGILFLCSPLSAYVTGHCLELTGGVGMVRSFYIDPWIEKLLG